MLACMFPFSCANIECVLRRVIGVITSCLTISPPSRSINNSAAAFPIDTPSWVFRTQLPTCQLRGSASGTNPDSYFDRHLQKMEQAVTSTNLYSFTLNLCDNISFELFWSLVDVPECRVLELPLAPSVLL